MKAIVTSIGEPTTDLCVWSLQRNGFEVALYEDDSSLAEKLAQIYTALDEDFIRVDGDVIPNRALIPGLASALGPEAWWLQFMTFDWYKQDVTYGGVQLVRKEALPALRKHVAEAMHLERPESYMFRLAEFHNPRRCLSNMMIMGLHGYKNDVERVKAVKTRRFQEDNYDFELAERINAL